MLKFLIILIPITSLLADKWNAKSMKREELVTTLFRWTPLPIWRRTPIPIWRRTPPPIGVNNLGELQTHIKLSDKSLNKTDVGKIWFIKDIYHLKKNDLVRQAEIKNMGRWILRWDLYDKKFKFGNYNKTDYLMYSKWRFLYEPPFSNIIDYFRNL